MGLQTPDGVSVELNKSTSDYNEGYLIAMEPEHHKIHEETHFECCDVDLDVDIATPKYWHILTPDSDVRCHFNFEVGNSLPGTLSLFEAPTVAAEGEGDALTVYNNDRNSSNTADVLVYKDPTISADGTDLIYVALLGNPGLTPNGASGGVTQRNREFILKADTSYAIKFLAINDDTLITMCLSWYEVENEND